MERELFAVAERSRAAEIRERSRERSSTTPTFNLGDS
jgi:hypothetical protein